MANPAGKCSVFKHVTRWHTLKAAGKSLEVFLRGRKEQAMWVFDGEQWLQDDETKSTAKPETARQQWHELVPELQVIEIVPVPVRSRYIPPMPLP